ncbi:hypothetical protein [Mycoplasma leonicaptivi]|uniref:hypothetical protein n=1 Tax=Mycoplasma leonicaptivi TaxID=36742 RepID=UPI0004826BCE|nr:hypothetical protein [Mycoplasma leonicaptivi]
MKNITMLEVAFAIVSQNASQRFTFNEIFDIVENDLKEDWIEKFINNNQEKTAEGIPSLTYEDVRLNKIGELYRLLTVDKRFQRNMDGTWELKIQ